MNILIFHGRDSVDVVSTNSVSRLIARISLRLAAQGHIVHLASLGQKPIGALKTISLEPKSWWQRKTDAILVHLGYKGFITSIRFNVATLKQTINHHYDSSLWIILACRYNDLMILKQKFPDFRSILWTHHLDQNKGFLNYLCSKYRPNAWVLPSISLRKAFETSMKDAGIWSPLYTIPYHLENDLEVAIPNTNATLASRSHIVYMGGSNPKKGWNTLKQALFLLPESVSCTIYVVGQGFSKNQKVLPNGVSIEFTGPLSRKEVFFLLHQSHIGVVPSTWYENAPTAFTEMASSGLQMVASNTGGISELANEDTVLIEDFNNPIAWVYALKSLCSLGPSQLDTKRERALRYRESRPTNDDIDAMWQQVLTAVSNEHLL